MIRKRRRLGLTNYKKRVALLKNGLPRVVARKSNRNITMQICEYQEDGDLVIAAANSNELKGLGWYPKRNTPTAYLTGMLLASKARELKHKEFILDIGLHKPAKASVLFAAAKGAVDNGLKIRNNIEFDEKRISGMHIKEYAELISKNGKQMVQFSVYMKNGLNPANIVELFNSVKSKIIDVSKIKK
jgi:large subunit ribosomal protein L18